MCGINGFNFKNPELIVKMNQLTSHRGPDDSDIWFGDNFSLGHDRLAIIDLSPRGHQPMWDTEHTVAIVFNGEIYNFKDLRVELEKKYKFISQSDTEVIIYAYKEYGVKCFEKFNGIFALAIFDSINSELILARDRVGVNPLYYYKDEHRFIFSSEIKAILAHNVPRAVDMEAFNLYFQLLYVPEPHTMFEGIKKLPPAHFLRFRNNQIGLERYWQVDDFSNLTSYREAKQQIKTLFCDSVKKQLISDRPVGVFLSGGIDSTAVLGVVNGHHHGKIKTFSVGFKDSQDPKKFNADFILARKTARYYDTDHHELLIGPEDILNNLDKIAWHLDEPNSNPTAGAMFLLSHLAKQEVAVVLGGDGGDELFGGYPRYYYSAWISLAQRVAPKTFRNIISSKLNLPANERRIAAFLSQKPDLLAKVISAKILTQNEADEYLKQKYFSHLCNPTSNRCNQCTDFEKYFMNVDRQSWLVDESLLRANKMSMAFGLESRVPILDYHLVELSARIPTAWKLSLWQRPSKFQGKRIWWDAIHEYLPNHVLNQQKRGWFTPMAKWLRQDKMRDFVSEILSPQNLPVGYFNASEMQKVWLDHLESKEYNLNIIWATVMWVLWYQRFIKSK